MTYSDHHRHEVEEASQEFRLFNRGAMDQVSAKLRDMKERYDLSSADIDSLASSFLAANLIGLMSCCCGSDNDQIAKAVKGGLVTRLIEEIIRSLTQPV